MLTSRNWLNRKKIQTGGFCVKLFNVRFAQPWSRAIQRPEIRVHLDVPEWWCRDHLRISLFGLKASIPIGSEAPGPLVIHSFPCDPRRPCPGLRMTQVKVCREMPIFAIWLRPGSVSPRELDYVPLREPPGWASAGQLTGFFSRESCARWAGTPASLEVISVIACQKILCLLYLPVH